jgi:hypothetical protein
MVRSFLEAAMIRKDIVVADVTTTAIRSLDLKYPEVTNEQRELLAEAKRKLSAE